MMNSISFDQAATYYDRTRNLSPDVMDAVVAMLVEELHGRRTVEVGVGTGRFALPLTEAGVEIVGVDLSRPMLERLIERAGGTMPLPLLMGDATSLPLRDASVGASVMCHVLHLIPDWRDALTELARVVAGDGVILIDAGGHISGPRQEIEERFRMEAELPDHPGATSLDDVDAAMLQLGYTTRELPRFDDVRIAPYTEIVDNLIAGLYSFTWPADQATRASAGARVRTWAESTFGDLTEPKETRWTVNWRAYERG